MILRDLIEKIVNGDDKLFEVLVRKLVTSTIYAFAQSEDDDELTLNFLNYLLEDDNDIEYIPLFTDEEEVNDFLVDADVPEGYQLYEFEGDLIADIMDAEQYLMVNPISGGIVFQGAHLKVFATVANDDKIQE